MVSSKLLDRGLLNSGGVAKVTSFYVLFMLLKVTKNALTVSLSERVCQYIR